MKSELSSSADIYCMSCNIYVLLHCAHGCSCSCEQPGIVQYFTTCRNVQGARLSYLHQSKQAVFPLGLALRESLLRNEL